MPILSLIDHAVLHPTQTANDVREACGFCRDLGVASVCVKPSMVKLASELLAGSTVVASTVIGFPHGGTSTAAKVRETEVACQQGAHEVDMVINLGWVYSADWQLVEQDIREVIESARANNAITKVIFETGLLPNDDVKVRLCEVSESAGAAFVKTSTGFGMLKNPDDKLTATGATERDVQLMRSACGSTVQVKASGGIRSLADAERFAAIGATRLGTSATKAIAAGVQRASREGY